VRRILFFWVVALGMPLTGLASANNFGAIAYDRRTSAFGVAWDLPTQVAANQRALKECAKNGKSCGVVIQFANQCAAYATGTGDAWGRGFGGSRALAERFALNYCNQNGKGCMVRVWGCTTRAGSGQGPTGSTQEAPPDRDRNRRDAEEAKRWGGQEQYDNVCRARPGGCAP
jgi:hypothetical protein